MVTDEGMTDFSQGEAPSGHVDRNKQFQLLSCSSNLLFYEKIILRARGLPPVGMTEG